MERSWQIRETQEVGSVGFVAILKEKGQAKFHQFLACVNGLMKYTGKESAFRKVLELQFCEG